MMKNTEAKRDRSRAVMFLPLVASVALFACATGGPKTRVADGRKIVAPRRDTGPSRRKTCPTPNVDSLKPLMRAVLADPNPKSRAAAVIAASQLFEKVVMAAALEDRDATVRDAAVSVLFARRTKAISALVRALERDLRQPTPASHLDNVLRAIAADHRFLPRLVLEVAKALESPSAQTRQAAILALGGFGPRAAPALAKALHDPNPTLRKLAVAAYGRVARRCTPRGTTATSSLLSDPNPRVRQEAVRALGSQGEAGLKGLIKATRDKAWRVRFHAVLQLGKVDTSAKKILPAVKASLRDRSYLVRKAAMFSLSRLGPAGERAIQRVMKSDRRAHMRRLARAILGAKRDGSAPPRSVTRGGPGSGRANRSWSPFVGATFNSLGKDMIPEDRRRPGCCKMKQPALPRCSRRGKIKVQAVGDPRQADPEDAKRRGRTVALEGEIFSRIRCLTRRKCGGKCCNTCAGSMVLHGLTRGFFTPDGPSVALTGSIKGIPVRCNVYCCTLPPNGELLRVYGKWVTGRKARHGLTLKVTRACRP